MNCIQTNSSINQKKLFWNNNFLCNAQECSHCIPLLSHSIIPLHINGNITTSLPLLLFIIHVVGAHRNPSYGALILFVLAEQMHPKRQVAILKKHLIYSLNRQDRQRVGEEITGWNGLPTVTLLTTDLLKTSTKPLLSSRIEIWSMGSLQTQIPQPGPWSTERFDYGHPFTDAALNDRIWQSYNPSHAKCFRTETSERVFRGCREYTQP